MEGLTKEEAIKRHRMLWNYIADESERIGVSISKYEALRALWPDLPPNKPMSDCWACETTAAIDDCTSCLIKWPGGDCGSYRNPHGLYIKWDRACLNRDVKEAVKLAREIANLPEA